MAKLGDVNWMTAQLVPITRCEPPEGERCQLAAGRSHLSATDAKRHALDNPGHYVLRETITRTEYLYQPSK